MGGESVVSLLSLIVHVKVLELAHDLLSLLLALGKSLQRFLDRARTRGGLTGAAQLNIGKQVHGQNCVVHEIVANMMSVLDVL